MDPSPLHKMRVRQCACWADFIVQKGTLYRHMIGTSTSPTQQIIRLFFPFLKYFAIPNLSYIIMQPIFFLNFNQFTLNSQMISLLKIIHNLPAYYWIFLHWCFLLFISLALCAVILICKWEVSRAWLSIFCSICLSFCCWKWIIASTIVCECSRL